MPYFDRPYFDRSWMIKSYLQKPVCASTVQPDAATRRRIAAEDARAILASYLRGMMWPGRIVVPVNIGDMQRIVDALEGE